MVTKKPQKNMLVERPPVIVVMGHIDHGKSRLLDTIRKTNVADREAGGITQHIGAYEVNHKNKEGRERKITFLDTPGHEAFAGIRSRGANIADIAVLVVSAEEGVKPQTLEALKCIKEAKIPYIVAINKIDKETADVERTKQDLATNEIYLEGYGGTIPYVPISAKLGQGVDTLLDMMLLLADLEELKGDPSAAAEGVVIESSMDPKRGIAASVIIKNGTIREGDVIMAGEAFAPLRLMENFQGKKLTAATFSSPVKIIGWNKLPVVGTSFEVCCSKKEAEGRLAASKQKREKISVGLIDETAGQDKIRISLIVKADSAGSLEAATHELSKIKEDWLHLNVILSGIGTINENDVKTAIGVKDGASIIGFSVGLDPKAKALAERLGVETEMFDVIYKMVEWLKKRVSERKPKIAVEEATGRAKILKVFSKNRDNQIVGGRVESGELKVGVQVKILRREAEIGGGKIKNLEQQKTRTIVIKKDAEFGALVEAKIEIAPGDYLESFIKKMA